MSEEPGKGKIHVDSDWKQEAERDKERLAAEEEKAEDQKRGPLPQPTMADLLNMIAVPAVMSIGGYRTPEGKVMPPDLSLAKYHIDMLELIEEKTKGNLGPEEGQMLAGILHQLRMQFTAVATGQVPDLGEAPPKEE
ncbi:MAG TPA: DUF1844 domain-containing protein [Phycisphaerae bacterium]|nr:DUF1844 domain-containing protein [Phycisphaerae bacterium]